MQEAITGGQQEQKDSDLSLAQLLTEVQRASAQRAPPAEPTTQA
jgi:hypothetical protein